MTKPYQVYIDGQWCDAGDGATFPAINPYNQQAWARIPDCTADDVARAVAAARKAFNGAWSRTNGLQRASLLLRLAQLLEGNAERMSTLETTDNGKIIRETFSQMNFAARVIRFFAGYADKIYGSVIPLDQPEIFDYTLREPLGVVALITAWNSPITLLMNKLPAALAAGNCVVIKPSEHASATTLELCRLVEEAGFPPGVVNVVTGDHRVGQALVENPDLNKVSFTGSPVGGRAIAAAAARNLVPVSLELGGKSPNIVFDDADFEQAATGALAGIFAAAGQTCIAGSRLLVQRPLYERMVDKLATRARGIRLGNPLLKDTEMGTTANRPQFDRILDFIASAQSEGATLVTGGRRASGKDLDGGFFVEPTIFTDVKPGMRIAQEEIFGPVLSIISFDSEDEAIAIGNDTAFGLAAGIWTRDVARAMRVSKAVKAGIVWVNTYRSVAAQAPVGGFKQSGYGRERGEAGLLEFLSTRNVMINYSAAQQDPFAVRT
ncbi:MAG: aldehyde dehydrogenase [Rubrivivax sp.]